MLITGASQGVGWFLAKYFAARGAHVLATARTEPALRLLAQEIGEGGGQCEYFPSDLRDVATLEALAAHARESLGVIDVLINNAADVTSKPFLETSPEEIADLVEANVTGALQLTRLVAPVMPQPGGVIVNVSSLAGYKPNPAQTVYSITKAAVNGMSEALRAELGPKGIHVMNVALASVGTETDTQPGQTPVTVFAKALERAIERREDELFLSPVSKWLMRLYRFYPRLRRY